MKVGDEVLVETSEDTWERRKIERIKTWDYRGEKCGTVKVVGLRTLFSLDLVKNLRTTTELLDADPNCKHEIEERWSGVKCVKCSGWFCY